MRTNIRPFLRFAAFFLVLALAVALANTCLIQTDTFVALMMDELKNSRDIELAVVGSSTPRSSASRRGGRRFPPPFRGFPCRASWR